MDSHPKRLMLVEDNPIHAKLIQMQLALAPCPLDVDWVTDGEAAVRHLHTGGQVPDLILLDLNLPGLNGHEVLKHIKEDDHLKYIPVVMITTSHQERDMKTAYEECVNAYLVKPHQLDELRRMLVSMVDFWCAWNQAPVS